MEKAKPIEVTAQCAAKASTPFFLFLSVTAALAAAVYLVLK
jgi:hypothetical protein